MPPGTWSTISIADKPCEVFIPSRVNDRGLALIYLHCVGQVSLTEHPPFAEQFEKYQMSVICPLTKQSWWTNQLYADFDPQLTAERHILDNIMPWIAREWHVKPPGIGLLGISMGGEGALRFSFKYPNTFPVVAAIAPAIDYWQRMKRSYDDPLWQMYSEPEQARQDSATLHIHPLNWPRNIWYATDPADLDWHESADRLRMKLAALGIPQNYDIETTHGGHSWTYFEHKLPEAMKFLIERLEAEQRRVV